MLNLSTDSLGTLVISLFYCVCNTRFQMFPGLCGSWARFWGSEFL